MKNVPPHRPYFLFNCIEVPCMSFPVAFSKFLALTTAIGVCIGSATLPAAACDTENCAAAEISAEEANALNDLGISLAVDGETLVGSDDVIGSQSAIRAVDVQVKFDGLDTKPLLNVSTSDLRRAYRPGESIRFETYTNYPDWIAHAEVRVQPTSSTGNGKVQKLPVSPGGIAEWQMPVDDGAGGEYLYVLRVYDEHGRFDETRPLTLKRSSELHERHSISPDQEPVAAGYGEDRTAVRNIPIHGGSVTVYGEHIPDGTDVEVFGQRVPVDTDRKFVTQRILPPGDHKVAVSVAGHDGKALDFSRDINIPANDFFYVALADLTIGRRTREGALADASNDDFDKVYNKGRLAFYLKGKIRGEYLLTAAADTRNSDLSDMFSNLNSRDPRYLLRRVDPDKYYPVYGDDSTLTEDAPTSGKFYVKLEKGDSHVMWGNFKAQIRESSYLRNERALYGARMLLRTETVTSFGDRKSETELYASQADTVPQRDVLRGTGGSAYFLKRQDISQGSETVTIEVRDPVSQRIVSRKILQYGADYTIDYIQGVIILKAPLASKSDDATLVRDTHLAQHANYLVVQYEYTPLTTDVDGYAYGGRSQTWISDNIRIGTSAMRENTESGAVNTDQTAVSVDVLIRKSDKTFLKAEIAESEGPGFGRSFSNDGGLTINDTTGTGSRSITAQALKVEGQADIAEFTGGALSGKADAYYEEREAGFSTTDLAVTSDQQLWGAHTKVALRKGITLALGYDRYEDDLGKRRVDANADVERELGKHWKLVLGVKHSELNLPTVADDRGSRTDAAAKITYSPNDTDSYYAFGQTTLDRDATRKRNDRAGVGSHLQITEKIGLKSELSYGTGGLGALGAVTYDRTANEHYYLGYSLVPERTISGSTLSGTDYGSLVLGSRHQYDDRWSAYTERNFDLFGERNAMTTTYGVTYTPDALWTWTGGYEAGHVYDPFASDIERNAVSLGVSYKDAEDLSVRLRGEARFDDYEDNVRDVNAYLLSAGVSYKLVPDWRLAMNADAVISESNQGFALAGDYVESSIGFAYRPVDNDRLNALFKYGYLYDLPGPNQVNAAGTTFGARQSSHVLSADFTYDLNAIVSVGGKYGFRNGEVETARGSGNFIDNDAHLGIGRLDFHVIKHWDLLLEGRALVSDSAATTEYGALTAVYRHVGNNMKVGVGYNFGRFTDDLTDLSMENEGVFLNVVGKL